MLDDHTCDRCGRDIAELQMPAFADAGMTSNYVLVNHEPWRKYKRKGEQLLCDLCLFDDPQYRKDHGLP